ncbi:hypothetical protein, partial [Enterococcus faecalis]|uniref:hypothetical protein n=1 Tax=Enterococcus faecalis TaxID=1351 RepID=UPI003D1103B9
MKKILGMFFAICNSLGALLCSDVPLVKAEENETRVQADLIPGQLTIKDISSLAFPSLKIDGKARENYKENTQSEISIEDLRGERVHGW